MQAASLGNSFLPSRNDASSIGGAASGKESFRSAFHSLLDRGIDPREPKIEMQPQDERTINPQHKRNVEREGRESRETREAVDGTESSRPTDETKRADADKQDEPQNDEAELKTAYAKAEKPKQDNAKDKEGDPSEAAALAAANGSVAPVEPVAPDEVAVDAAPAAESTETVDATQLAIDPLKQALEAGVESDEPAQPGATVPTAKVVAPKTGDSKLDAAVAEMDAVPEPAEAKIAAAGASDDAQQDPSDLLDQSAGQPEGKEKPVETKAAPSTFDRELNTLQNNTAPAAKPDASQAAKVVMPQNLTPEQKFVQDNVDQVVTSVRTQSTAGGGTMNVRLDPPELGALQVAVKMIEGRLTASFTTSNEQATQLLSHSLQHLKSSLEASGVSVDRIEVRQAPPSESSNAKSNSDSQQQQQRGFDGQSQQSEQNRKEMVQKMWRKFAFGTDELDLVA
jgi:flagellar hook-length control protein FliK